MCKEVAVFIEMLSHDIRVRIAMKLIFARFMRTQSFCGNVVGPVGSSISRIIIRYRNSGKHSLKFPEISSSEKIIFQLWDPESFGELSIRTKFLSLIGVQQQQQQHQILFISSSKHGRVLRENTLRVYFSLSYINTLRICNSKFNKQSIYNTDYFF